MQISCWRHIAICIALVSSFALTGESAVELKWVGKENVVNHHLDVPYHILEKKWTFDATKSGEAESLPLQKKSEPSDSGNMIIHGDNLLALKSLLPKYEGKVKCIYIDPPYNTGNEGWCYNDNVNDPRIKKWLGEVVGKEGEDFTRHDKWLCMMYPRLKLLQKLLAKDGAIFISIDDNELYNLKAICDEIFGINSFVATVSWQRTYSTRNDAKGIVSEVEHILVYSKTPGWQPKKLPRTAEMDKSFKNPDNDVSPWTSSDAFAPDSVSHQSMIYAIQHPFNGELIYPTKGRHWALEQEQILKYLCGWAEYELREIDDAEKRAAVCGISASEVRHGVKAIMLKKSLEESKKSAEAMLKRGQWPKFYFTKNGKGGIRRKTYLENVGGVPPTNLWEYKDVGHTDEAKKELKAIFGGDVPFDTPKPTRLIERILQIAADKDSIVLDTFAGSGTTAHAVLMANAADGGTRRFVLVEMDDYAETVTAERVKRVIEGYGDGEKAVDGTGGSFSFCELGEPLMEGELLNPKAGETAIREFVWYSETKTAMGENCRRGDDSTGERTYLGTNNGTAYYFFYEPDKVTELNRATVRRVKHEADDYIVYADVCALSAAELKRRHITFKKIPRDIASK